MISTVIASINIENDPKILENISGCQFEDIVIVSGRNPSMQRNEGVKKAKGENIYFLDDDSIPAGENIDKAERILSENSDVAVIGGPALIPREDTIVQKTFGSVLGSIFASGKSRARYVATGKQRYSDEKEVILCNMIIRKDVFEKLGGFREDLYPNEENEFLNRVKANGYKIIYDPDFFILRSHRKDFQGFFRQCFFYGKGRAEQILTGMKPGDLINFAPLFFIIYAASIPFVNIGFIWEIPLDIYIIMVLLFSLLNSLKLRSLASFVLSAVSYPVLHISYGIGMFFGFIMRLFRKKKVKEFELNIRTYKTE